MTDYYFRRERAADSVAVERLFDIGFGTERHRRGVYRLRGRGGQERAVSQVAVAGSIVVASLRFWPITLAGYQRVLLLGPLSVAPAWRHRGLGAALVQSSLELVDAGGYQAVVVSGEPNFYARFGFTPGTLLGLTLPMPIEPERVMIRTSLPLPPLPLGAARRATHRPSRRQPSARGPKIKARAR